MLWDPSGTSWIKLEVYAQPAWILLKADGTIAARELGGIPFDTVLSKA